MNILKLATVIKVQARLLDSSEGAFELIEFFSLSIGSCGPAVYCYVHGNENSTL
jgi:hypothetical protein